jgi:predicted nucleic acid-binding protein
MLAIAWAGVVQTDYVGAAQLSGCKVILSEDMQDGMRFDGGCRVRNPFRIS